MGSLHTCLPVLFALLSLGFAADVGLPDEERAIGGASCHVLPVWTETSSGPVHTHSESISTARTREIKSEKVRL